MRTALDKALRSKLEAAVEKARDVAELAAKEELDRQWFNPTVLITNIVFSMMIKTIGACKVLEICLLSVGKLFNTQQQLKLQIKASVTTPSL
mgnify:CR=1 FL=1